MYVCIVGMVAFKQTSFTSERPGGHGSGLNVGRGWGSQHWGKSQKCNLKLQEN